MLEIWLLTAGQRADRNPARRAHRASEGGLGVESSIVVPEFVDARVGPRGSLENLSQAEIGKLLDSSQGGLYPLFRKCALAVLNSGADTDNAKEIFDRYRDFDSRRSCGTRGASSSRSTTRRPRLRRWPDDPRHQGAPVRRAARRGVHLERNRRQRPLRPQRLGVHHQRRVPRAAQCASAGLKARPNLVVCWGGHSIGNDEYKYTKKVGYEMGLRGLDVCTGCGPGAMKGPMKGATIGHAKQRIEHGRYIGLTEPGIIAAEPPNPIVNQLVIMPDIEKRLEAFVRMAHGIVVFPGRRRHGRRNPVPARHPARSGESRAAASRRAHRSCGERGATSSTSASFIGGTLGEQARAAFHRDHRRSGGGGAPARATAWRRCASSADSTAIPTTSTGCCPCARRLPAAVRSDARIDARPRSCIAISRRTSSPRICGARSPASSPAT